MADSSPVFGLEISSKTKKGSAKLQGSHMSSSSWHVLWKRLCGHGGAGGLKGEPPPTLSSARKVKKINKSRVLHENYVSTWVSQPMGDCYIQTPGSPQIIIQQQQGSWGRDKAP